MADRYIDIAAADVEGPIKLGGIRNGYPPTGGRPIPPIDPPEGRRRIRLPDITPGPMPPRPMTPIGARGVRAPRIRPRLERWPGIPMLDCGMLLPARPGCVITPRPCPGPGVYGTKPPMLP